jgi:hypothetical protein
MHVKLTGVLDELAGIAPAAEIRIEHAECQRGGARREVLLDECAPATADPVPAPAVLLLPLPLPLPIST